MSSVALSLIGIILALAFLIYGFYKGYSALTIAPIGVLIVIVVGGLPFTATSKIFFSGLGTMVNSFLPVLLGACILGTCFSAVGGGEVLAGLLIPIFGAKNVVPCIVFLALLCGYSSMSFAGYMLCLSVGLAMCKKANLPSRILPGCILLGGYTVTLGGPGSVSAINLVPADTLGATPMAGALIGFAGAIFTIVGGTLYLMWQEKRWVKRGECFGPEDEKHITEEIDIDSLEKSSFKKVVLTLLPIAVMLVLLNVFHLHALWSTLTGTLVLIIINFKKFTVKEWLAHINKGALSPCVAVMGIAIMGGFGTVCQNTPAYSALLEWLGRTNVNPYVLAILSTSLLAGLTGSGTSAVGLGMQSLGDYFLASGAQGYSLPNISRLVSMSAVSFDSLPSSGSMYAVMNTLGYSYKDAYFPVFMCTVVFTLMGAVFVGLPLALLGL